MDQNTPCYSFIGIVDFSQEAKWLYMTDSVVDLLGYEPHELYGHPSLELVHPDEVNRVRKLHHDTIKADKAAVLVYLRMKHKDPYKGYVLCGVSRTVVHNVLVGSVSFASPGAKALHNASTAQEITVISPAAENFQFRRWNDPSPMPPSPPPFSTPPSTPADPISYDHLPSQSFRTALILNRFSLRCTIQYCSNDLLIESTEAIGRSFFDYVARKDEAIVTSWIDVIKTWGVNERGQPSDGGFGFGKFALLAEARESEPRQEPPNASRHHKHGANKSRSSKRSSQTPRKSLHQPLEAMQGTISVDAIFSAHSDGLMVILRRAS
ncbi:uncharacterized protein BT62DRAFT_969389 [Guyanagaster necrorhizus]|uniref:PAS domain-containing protein n=1 Tax=Guyanagaster necrorhizus TaxID=856835 RepID=A0A9P8ATA5_9AGAR|nr:uncharacterized protein BT62DRAFT_969389 [Guyanagaster necrorhizus MCA 3950]KAG7445687.1 hypothetical protein BT62DRAFT_969389 [Guyanagaster necrorhizus MCA 3950]